MKKVLVIKLIMCDFDIDDSFLLEALEDVEKTEVENAEISSTPKDLEFSSNKSTQENICAKNSTLSKSDTPNSNFRSKLIKTLLDSKNMCNSLQSGTNLSTEINLTPINKENMKRKFNENEIHVSNKTDSTCISKFPRISPIVEIEQLRNKGSRSSIPLSSPCFKRKSDLNLSSATDFSPNPPTIRKRKFPGPAGLLPKWEQRMRMKCDSSEEEGSKFERDFSEDSICSQTTAQDFASGPWREMLLDMEGLGAASQCLFESNKIRWLLRKACLRGQAAIRKIPSLVVMIRSLDPSHSDATAVFQDDTGEIPGTISQGVLEKYPNSILTGTVLVLKDTTLLSPASLQPGIVAMGQMKKHYLNVTLNSVVTIYSSNDAGSVCKIEVVKVTPELLSSLSLRSGDAERTEVIERDEREEDPPQSLFRSFHSPSDASLKQTSSRQSLQGYKNPLIATPKPIPNARSVVVTQTPKSRPPTTSRFNVQRSPPNRTSNDPIKPPPPSQPSAANDRKVSNGIRIQSVTDAFQSFSDDEEFDSLLASINTDSL